jgi:hypothetical protein
MPGAMFHQGMSKASIGADSEAEVSRIHASCGDQLATVGKTTRTAKHQHEIGRQLP